MQKMTETVGMHAHLEINNAANCLTAALNKRHHRNIFKPMVACNVSGAGIRMDVLTFLLAGAVCLSSPSLFLEDARRDCPLKQGCDSQTLSINLHNFIVTLGFTVCINTIPRVCRSVQFQTHHSGILSGRKIAVT